MQETINWVTLLVPLTVTVLINVIMGFYFLGGQNSRMDGFNKRLDKVERELEKNQTIYHRIDDRVQALALVVARLEQQLTDIKSHLDSALQHEMVECPLVEGLGGAARQKRRPAEAIKDAADF